MTSPKEQVRWLPLESNPESFNYWATALGLPTRSSSSLSPNSNDPPAFSNQNETLWVFRDCVGLDNDSLASIPQPVKAVVLLFPVNEAYAETMKQLELLRDAGDQQGFEDVLYFEQTIRNACGTYALIHSLGNAGIELRGGPLKTIFAQCKDKSPSERSDLLIASSELASVHHKTASSGQTPTPNLDDSVSLHYSAFVARSGQLLELDGGRGGPISHGAVKVGLLEDAAEVIKKIVATTDSLEFSVITLGPATDDDE